MTNLVYLPTKSHASKMQSHFFFLREEFRAILNIYSKHVSSGDWKDYAIDTKSYLVMFSIFKHSYDAPLFSIAKRLNGKKYEFLLMQGQRTLKRSSQLNDILKEVDKPLQHIKCLK